MPNRPKKPKREEGNHRTSLAGHARQGNTLLPPFLNKIPQIAHSSWMNDRLPEMLWAALIRAALNREQALGSFRRIINFIGVHDKRKELSDLTLTGIAKIASPLRQQFIEFILEPPMVSAALASLRLFQGLPAREDWDRALPQNLPDLGLLMQAVGSTLWHQSLEATDCRWLKIMAQVVSGSFEIPHEIAHEWFHYPNEGDQRDVRPAIRAAEIGPSSFETPDLAWPQSFWSEAWEHTPCFALASNASNTAPQSIVTRQKVQEVVDSLRSHWEQTHTTTAVDARHDGVFGMALYCLSIMSELLGTGVAIGILGRLGLRTILEVRINMKYLLQKNEETLWKQWRTYGASQAKLSALKFDGVVNPPKHINVQSIENIANEDIWEELLAINLAGWSGVDLRRMSEQAQLKTSYDQHYGWTSAYAHGMWGAIRETCFATCGNPLHRLHRYPEYQPLSDVVEDAATLVDELLEDLNAAFPKFEERLLAEKNQSA